MIGADVDKAFFDAIHKPFHCDFLDFVVAMSTDIIAKAAAFVLPGLLLVHGVYSVMFVQNLEASLLAGFTYFRNEAATFVVIVFNLILNTFVVKRVVNRKRPHESFSVKVAIDTPTDSSFVSTHTISISSVFWSYLCATGGWDGLSLILLLLTFFVGLSRVWLGVHYVSDVIGAFVLSGIVAWVVFQLSGLVSVLLYLGMLSRLFSVGSFRL